MPLTPFKKVKPSPAPPYAIFNQLTEAMSYHMPQLLETADLESLMLTITITPKNGAFQFSSVTLTAYPKEEVIDSP